jgi:hypothetical protein
MDSSICFTGNGQLLLAALVRHLDHKNVEGNLVMKTNIVILTAVLARQSKAKATVAEVGAMSDLSKHLRRSLQVSMETPVGGSVRAPDENISLQAAIEECLMEFGRRVHPFKPSSTSWCPIRLLLFSSDLIFLAAAHHWPFV